MTHAVVFAPEARADLRDLYLIIAAAAGDARALGFIARLEAACLALAEFPERGTRRDAVLPGLRTFGVARRATIAFIVTPRRVTILRVLYGGRDLVAAVETSAG